MKTINKRLDWITKWLPDVIDLAWQRFDEQTKELIKLWYFKKNNTFKHLVLAWFLLTLLLIVFLPKNVLKANYNNELNTQDQIRINRLKSCENAYKESWIKDKFIYKQLMVVRCATYSTLIYAYESNFWQSYKCINNKNCYWIKWNWYDTPAWFLTFDTYEQGRDYFAKKYFKWHYKKKINTFVNDWSMTERYIYKQFMFNNYTKIYKELEYLYLTQR